MISSEALVSALQAPALLTLRSFTVSAVQITTNSSRTQPQPPPPADGTLPPPVIQPSFTFVLDGVRYEGACSLTLTPFQHPDIDVPSQINIATFCPPPPPQDFASTSAVFSSTSSSASTSQSSFSKLYGPFEP